MPKRCRGETSITRRRFAVLTYQESPASDALSGSGVKGDRRSGGEVGGGISSNGTNNRPSGASWDSRNGAYRSSQSVHQPGYRQGKTKAAEERILAEAIALEEAGAFAVVLSIFQRTWDCGLRKSQRFQRLALVQVHTVMVRY